MNLIFHSSILSLELHLIIIIISRSVFKNVYLSFEFKIFKYLMKIYLQLTTT